MDQNSSGPASESPVGRCQKTSKCEWLLVNKRDQKSKSLPRGMVFVGREDCDLLLTSATVDKRHAVIFYNSATEHFHVKDLNSNYGTYVNDERVPDQCYKKLDHLDRIRFGFGPDLFIVHRLSELSDTHPLPLMDCANQSLDSDKEAVASDEHEIISMQAKQVMNHNTSVPQPVPTNDNPTQLPASVSPALSLSQLKQQQQNATKPLQTRDVLMKLTNKSSPASNDNNIKCENNSTSSLSSDSLDDILVNRKLSVDKNLSPVNERPEASSNVADALVKCDGESDDMNISDLSKEETNKSPAEAERPAQSPAMAFIIAFDDEEDSSNKKRLNIRDSIRQFAPPKPDSIERPRTSKMTNALKDKANNKLQANKKAPSNTPTNQKSNMIVNEECLPTTGQINSANFLIQRLFASQQPVNKKSNLTNDDIQVIELNDSSASSSPVKEKISPGEKDSGVSDDKSENGTYTVEAEQSNPDLEEARRKIDEVFGVFGCETMNLTSDSDASPQSSMSYNNNNNKAHSAWMNQVHTKPPTPAPRNKNSAPRQLLTKSDLLNQSPQLQASFNTSTFTRPKNKSPCNSLNVNIPQVYSESEENSLPNETFVNNCGRFNQNGFSSQLPKNNEFQVHNFKQNHLTRLNNDTGLRSPSTLRKLQEQQIREKTLNGRRKMSLSFSDAESINSDDSARSSNSNLSKNEGNLSSISSASSKMRFNKAFALRRARLGLETPGIPIELKKNDKNANKPPSGLQHKLNKPAQNFSRNDGGRFSLRLQNGGNSKRRPNLFNAFVKDEVNNRMTVQRKGSDPSQVNNKFNAVSDNEQWRKRNNLSAVRSNGKSNDLQKSSSFTNSHFSDGQSNCNGKRTFSPFHAARLSRPYPRNQVQIEQHLVRSNPHSPEDKEPPIMTRSLVTASTKQSTPSQVSSIKSSQTSNNNKSPKELSALDSLVVSAINQLSQKLRINLGNLLEKERLKHQDGSEVRLMIEEILPQVGCPDKRFNGSHDNISKDLSNILKNLRKVEQSLEVFSALLDPAALNSTNRNNKMIRNGSCFVVDV